ncbi:sugar phosphate nucleotidyltransferase [Candidatus Pelagibacter sp.]|nr:sugar phosphate nucleotidyltransferase [Candidatus Pelagibacter sp.]
MTKINTALILCAGYGKRLNPLTLENPKPLLEINNLTMLENTINLIKNLGIKKIKLNTFYLEEKIKSFIKKKNFNIEIDIVEDGNKILDTGGGIYNMMRSSPESEPHFLVFNPDTIWEKSYVKTINEMIEFYFLNPNPNTLLIVDKKLSFDKNFKGDFSFFNNKLIKHSENKYIYTGCQIINRRIVSDGNWNRPAHNFSITTIWDAGIKADTLFGFESKNKFYHITNLEIYNKLLKSY